MVDKIDPVLFEVLIHRLQSVIAEGYYTIGRVSGNPVVYEAGDHQEAVMTANGDLVQFGAGVIHWTPAMSMAVKHLIELYGGDPGFKEGDQFMANDPYTGCLHAMDIQILTPVFWEGKLIAWIGCASHQTDIGGIDAGGFCIRATERFQEGFQTPGIKIVEDGKIKRDVEETFRNMVRTPDICILDIRAKIAACNVMKDRLLEIIDHYNIELILVFFEEVMDYSEKKIRAKLREIPDGKWRTVNYVEGVYAPYYKIECTLIKEKDTLTLDFTGTSPQTPGSENMSKVGAIGSAVNPFIPMMCHDVPWNSGMYRCLEFILPEGTVVNPKQPAGVSFNTPAGASYITIATVQNVYAKMLLSSEKYRIEACAGIMTGSQNPILNGINRDGTFFTAVILDLLAGGSGALTDRDGDNSSANMWCSKVMIVNVETIELLYPLLYIMRREAQDSCGPGKFRGGLGQLVCMMPWGTSQLTNVHMGTGREPRNTLGLSGGYPAASTQAYNIRNTAILDLFKQGRLPRTVEEFGGTKEGLEKTSNISELNDRDVICFYTGAGGGFGDPLERDPKFVLKDVIKKDVSIEQAEKDYGVVIDPDRLEVDYKETEQERRNMVGKRLKTGRK